MNKLKTFLSNHKTAIATAAAIAVPSVLYAALPASGPALDFQAAMQQVQDWTEGTLGALLAFSLLVVGIGMGIMRQSIAAVVPGVASAIALSQGPGILLTIFGATV
ncbi:MAG: hypothetical protein C9356_15715 [Oleiphilus sp.]|nr:MAG: hypothetical protein C9356_15715 [Oleiphilus sp.]